MRKCKQSWALLGVLVLAAYSIGADDNAIEERMRHDITFLASDECEGRGVGTAGLDKAAEFVAKEFAKAGLKPGGVNGSWFQPFEVAGASTLQGASTLKLKGPLGQEIDLKLGDHFQVMGLSGSGKVTAPLVFVGFGANAKDIGYNDYKDIDVAGKVVVILRHTPRWSNANAPFDGARKDEHASLEKKQGLAEANKAAAVIVVNDLSETGDKLMPFSYIAGATPSSIPGVHVKRAVVDEVLQASLGERLADVEKAIDRDLKPRSAALPGWTATIETGVKRNMVPVKNVVGVLEGAGPLAKETIVVGAHYDHLGYGGRSSLAKNPKQKDIHHGADDNASGTTALIELARRFGGMKDRQGRRLVFLAFSAEEIGLLGSRHYCNKEPLFPLADTAAMVNLDMVGRLQEDKESKKGKLIIEGTGTAKTFDKLVDKLNEEAGFKVSKKASGLGPSDHDSFTRKKIPVLFFFTGSHSDYHKPSDTSDKINVRGMKQVTDLADKLVAFLASDAQRPEYVEVKSSTPTRTTKGPRLGIMPDYEEGKEGLLVGGVVDNGPAAEGGLKQGDLIVELDGKAVKNINSYMAIMAQQSLGRTIPVLVVRDGKKLALKVTLK